MKSLTVLQHPFASPAVQLGLLNLPAHNFPLFKDKLASIGMFPLTPTRIEIFQVNVGKKCNQTCRHCHVDAGPDRKEMMSRETMQQCLNVLEKHDIPVVDITGGAPEIHPGFRWFVEQCSLLKKKIMVRCNLTIILANKKYHDLPEFYRQHRVEVVSSLPFYNSERTDKQRGEGVFEQSVKALQLLNKAGYGMEDSGLSLNLVYNPAGAFLPGSQPELEQQFKEILFRDFGISFNKLFCITNIPISRFLEYLVSSGNYERYLEKLIQAFNPAAAAGVMCRNTISVGWDGSLYDCDFNQMLDLHVDKLVPQHVSTFNQDALNKRKIVLNQHCYGCTAGAGSGCGGTIT